MIESPHVADRAALLSSGISRRALTAAIATGRIVRVRRNTYMSPDTPQSVRDAVRIGGRLTCLSLLQLAGVFVFANSAVHVHISRGMSRLRSPRLREPLAPRAGRAERLHWFPLARPDDGTAAWVGVVDALAHAVRCQPARYAIATLDSALRKGLVQTSDLVEVFAALPSRYAVLRGLVDGRAESGPETLMRLMLRALGCRVDLQVHFPGVGWVDLFVDGWLVIECDSEEFHSSWQQQVKDRNRDLALAAQGISTLRLTASQIMYRPEEVLAAVRGLLTARSGIPA